MTRPPPNPGRAVAPWRPLATRLASRHLPPDATLIPPSKSRPGRGPPGARFHPASGTLRVSATNTRRGLEPHAANKASIARVAATYPPATNPPHIEHMAARASVRTAHRVNRRHVTRARMGCVAIAAPLGPLAGPLCGPAVAALARWRLPLPLRPLPPHLARLGAPGSVCGAVGAERRPPLPPL